MKPAYRVGLALVWLAVLAVVGYAISQRLHVSGDLRKFMPGQAGDRVGARVEAARAAGRRWAAALLGRAAAGAVA